MHSPLCRALIVLITGLTIDGPFAQAETIWQWTHQAEGEGWANVFDGGPVEFDSDSTLGVADGAIRFSASDLTRPGVLGASYLTGGESNVGANDERLAMTLRLFTHYSATSRLGSDRPGGEGNARISSIVEFVMPADEVEWLVRLEMDQTKGFSGSAHLLLEDLTDGEMLFEIYESVEESFILSGFLGERMRMTFEVQAQGSAPPGIPALLFYEVDASSSFIVPEPAGGMLAALGAIVALRRRS